MLWNFFDVVVGVDNNGNGTVVLDMEVLDFRALAQGSGSLRLYLQ